MAVRAEREQLKTKLTELESEMVKYLEELGVWCLRDGLILRFGAHIDCLTGFAFKSSGYSENAKDIRLLRGDNIEPRKPSMEWRKILAV